jgi:hypothetical protein
LTVTYEELVGLWGRKGVIQVPAEELDEVAAERPMAPGGEEQPAAVLPLDVPDLFTVVVENDEAELFSTVPVRDESGSERRLLVLGATAEDPELLFCLDTLSGEVLLLDTATPSLERVNGSLPAFVEFLYRVTPLVNAHGRERVQLARALRADLAGVDPGAFTDPESWWPVTLDELS